MATDNRTLLQKADLTLAQIAAGGLLQTGQVDQFIILAINEPVMTKDVLVTPMKNPVEERDKMRFSGRVLRPGTEATALSLTDRAVPALSLYTLTSVLYRAEVRITDEVLEDQIERGAFKNTVMRELSRAIGRDMEFVAIQGDVGSATALLATQNGWIALATANQVLGGGAELGAAMLRDTLDTMPTEFRDRSKIAYYTNDHAEIRYVDETRQRATSLGDKVLDEDVTPAYRKIKVKAIPEFPDALGAGTNETRVLLSDPKNFVIGFQRKVRVGTQRDEPAGVTIVVATVRFAVNIVETNAVCRITGVLGQ